MIVYNYSTKSWESSSDLIRGIVYIDNHYIEYGYFNQDYLNVVIEIDDKLRLLFRKECCKKQLYWINNSCCYTLKGYKANNIITVSKYTFNYPINRCYNLSKLSLSEKQVNVELDEDFKYLRAFTFGFEYETSSGNIPWIDCLDTNLVPLYDGSITGHEYVTFPLNINNISLIKEHLMLLNKYTRFNHNCSLHIHIGGFPIDYDAITDLCNYWIYFQYKLINYLPEYSYQTELYKDNGKAYNKPWKRFKYLSDIYTRYTNNTYIDNSSFYLPNQYDEEEEQKWKVEGRYHNMNIMHLISNNEHKTVEFRFLRPTTNYYEIKWYVLVLSAFLNYVINDKSKLYKSIDIDKVLYSIFPQDLANKLLVEGKKLYHLRKIQVNNNDRAGINDQLKQLYLEMTNFKI